MKVTSISLTDLEYRLLRVYADKSGKPLSRLLVKATLSEADLWIRDNGFLMEWEQAMNAGSEFNKEKKVDGVSVE